MKIVKLSALCIFILCLTVFFASCGAEGILKYANDELIVPATVESAVKQSSLFGTVESTVRELVLLKKTEAVTGETPYNKNSYTVFNLAEKSSVFSIIEPDEKLSYSVRLDNIDTACYFIVTATVSGEIESEKIYDAQGSLIATSSGASDYVKMLDDFKFADNVYTVDKNGKIVVLGEADKFVNLTNATNFSKDYAYVINANGISTMTTLGEALSAYEFKTQYTRASMGILQNGNIYIQYFDTLPDDAKKYDVFTSGNKTNLITELYNVKNGSVKELNIDFVCRLNFGGENIDTTQTYVDDFKLNVASITKIVDQRLETNNRAVVVDNKLNIKAENDDVVPGFTTFDCLGKDRFVASDSFGANHFIIKNKIVKSVSSNVVSYNNKYIYTDDAVFDLDFEEVLDLTEKKYTVVGHTDNSLYLNREVGDSLEYSILTSDATVKTIVAADSDASFVGLSMNLYCIKTAEGKFAYYNEAGVVVGTYESEITSVAFDSVSGNRLILAGEVYYLLTAPAAEK